MRRKKTTCLAEGTAPDGIETYTRHVYELAEEITLLPTMCD